ncbi:unnamed protein product [Oikopleura dioica]|uniref:RRM domain-containing protein n=1 Tax=Oikopleura dioica TaxID=34765 RepID=E4XLV7_OIKDI|nr:unnamed protein product [Oikopleura dioica]
MKDINKREPNSSICIRPIDACIRPDEIKAEFKEFGEIKEIRIPVDFETREPRGFAYVDFEEVESAIEARDIINGRILFDRKVQVYYSNGTKKLPSEMVRQKECVKIQKQLKSTRKTVDEVIRQNTEKSAPTGNVKGTLHFLKVASELEATKKYQTKYVTRIRIDDRIPKEKTTEDERRERRDNFRDDRPDKRRRRRTSSSSRSRSSSSRRYRSRSRSSSRSRSYSRSHRSRKYSESSSLSRSPSPRNFRIKKSKKRRTRRRTPVERSSSRSRSPSRSRRRKKKRSKRHRKYSSSSSSDRSRSPSRSRRHRKFSRSTSSASSSRSPPTRKKHSKKSKRKRKRQSSSSRSRSRSAHHSSRRK